MMKEYITPETEFRINEYITLKLEDKKTNIYVNGNLFRQCKYLLLEIPVNKVSLINKIDSIDEAAAILDRSLEGSKEKKIEVLPEVEFWGHCSNLQVWAENNYNTSVIHSNLGFPLLKKLVDVGDYKAQNVFKDEIIERYVTGNTNVRNFLTEEGFLNNLTEDEQLNLLENLPSNLKTDFLIYLSDLNIPLTKKRGREEVIKIYGEGNSEKRLFLISNGFLDYLDNDEKIRLLSPKEAIALQELKNKLKVQPHLVNGPDLIYNWNYHNKIMYSLSDRQVTGLRVYNLNIETVPESLREFEFLNVLVLSSNNLRKLPKFNYRNLKMLYLSQNNIETIPESIGKLKSLKKMSIGHNNLKSIPKDIGNLRNLEVLYLNNNQIEALPESIGNLLNLRELYLNFNQMKKLPVNLCNLESLEILVLNYNQIKELPRDIGNLKSLKQLILNNNKLKQLPDSIKDLDELAVLYVNNNQITKIPNSLRNQMSNKKLYI